MVYRDDQFYVSIKGVIILREKVLLLRKLSGDWDLPGGRLSAKETPSQCLVREAREETGLDVRPGRLLHRWLRRRPVNTDIFLVSHLCHLSGQATEITLSPEHDEAAWFSVPDIERLVTSKGIRKSVARAIAIPR